MNGLVRFKGAVYVHALIAAAVIELLSIPVLGLDAVFVYGLCLGTATAITNFSVMAYVFNRLNASNRIALTLFGYAFRLSLAGAACLAALKAGLSGGAGALAGLLTVNIAMYYLHVFRAEKPSRRDKAGE